MRSLRFVGALSVAGMMLWLTLPNTMCQAEEGARFSESPKAEAALEGQLQPFTVADSIAMTHIVEPSEEYSQDPPPASPDGRRFLIVTERGILASNTRRYSLLVFDANDLSAPPKTIVEFDSSSNRPGILNARWLDGAHISLIAEGPGEVPQIYIVDCSTRNKKKLTNDALGVVAYAISTDQRKAVYAAHWPGDEAETRYKELHGFVVTDEPLEALVNGSWRKPSRVFQMYVKDLVTGTVREVSQRPFVFNPDIIRIWISPDGRYAVTQQGAPSLPQAWADYDDQIIKERVHEFSGRTYKVTPFALYQLMLLNTETGEMKPLINAPCEVPTAVWSEDSRNIVVSDSFLPLDISDADERRRRQSRTVIASVDILSGGATRLLETPDDAVLKIESTSKPDTFVLTGWHTLGRHADGISPLPSRQFHQENGKWREQSYVGENSAGLDIRIGQRLDQWPRLEKTDRRTGANLVVFDPNPQLKTFRFGHRETVHWTGKRGEPLEGGLVYPVEYSAGKKYPLVIQTHGFSPAIFLLDGPFTTAMAAEELATKGVFVLQLGAGPLYYQARDTPDFGPVDLSMLESAIDFLDGKGLIDRDAVGLVGWSISGFGVRYALTHSSYSFAAVTSAEGNDWGYWSYVAGGNDPAWAAQSEAPFGGPPWNNNWGPWMRDSISFNFEKIHTPLRLESDGNDYAEVLNEWENFVALKRLHKPIELLFLSHGDHPVVKPWDRMASQQGNVDWLLFWLKGEVDPDPSKAEQYARWRELRKLQHVEKAQ